MNKDTKTCEANKEYTNFILLLFCNEFNFVIDFFEVFNLIQFRNFFEKISKTITGYYKSLAGNFKITLLMTSNKFHLSM